LEEMSRLRSTVWLLCHEAQQVGMPAGIGRLSVGAGHRYPVTIRKASLMTASVRRMWPLRRYALVQYSAVEWTKAKVAVCNFVVPAPQLEPASGLKCATGDVSFL